MDLPMNELPPSIDPARARHVAGRERGRIPFAVRRCPAVAARRVRLAKGVAGFALPQSDGLLPAPDLQRRDLPMVPHGRGQVALAGEAA